MSDLDPKAVEEAVEWWELGQWFDLPSVYHERLELMATVSRDWLRIKSIPDDMVERGARAEYEARAEASDYEWPEWTDLDDGERYMWVEYMRPALTAALSPSEEE